jgi:membrane-associated phospholipid phosphatase
VKAATAGKKAVPAARAAASRLEKADVAVARAAGPYLDTPLVHAIGLIGEAGDQPQLRTLCAALIAAGLASGNRRLAVTGMKMLAAHTLATVAKDFVKRRVDRTRPRTLVREGRYEMEPGRHEGEEITSFPSGHTAGAVAVARAFARSYPEHAAAAYTAAGAIALAQVPRCAHYPTDIVAGAVVGLAAESVGEQAQQAVGKAFPRGRRGTV